METRVRLGPWLAAFERMLGSARRHAQEGRVAPPSSPRTLLAYGATWHPGRVVFLMFYYEGWRCKSKQLSSSPLSSPTPFTWPYPSVLLVGPHSELPHPLPKAPEGRSLQSFPFLLRFSTSEGYFIKWRQGHNENRTSRAGTRTELS